MSGILLLFELNPDVTSAVYEVGVADDAGVECLSYDFRGGSVVVHTNDGEQTYTVGGVHEMEFGGDTFSNVIEAIHEFESLPDVLDMLRSRHVEMMERYGDEAMARLRAAREVHFSIDSKGIKSE